MMTNLLILLCLMLNPKPVARITVKAGEYDRTNLPVKCRLPEDAAPFQLIEIKGGKRTLTPFQIKGNELYFLLDGVTLKNHYRTYELVKYTPDSDTNHAHVHEPALSAMQLSDSGNTLTLLQNGKPLLQYHSGVMAPPPGVPAYYQRSGFIHPLWAPDGQVLTNIQPKDHYHHYGIWNPWTHTRFQGKETDFWNLQKKEGTVRFTAFGDKTFGAVWCGFQALQDHVAINNGKETTALHETWDIKAYNHGADASQYTWDFTSILKCATEDGITMLQYRYGGGFGLRATAAWKANNCEVVTDLNKTRNEADSTRARWIKITGRTEAGQTGMLILCAPDNFDAPQPVRVWPDNAEGGELMLNYSPTKMKEWKLTAGHTYTQRYRIIVFNNDLSAAEAEAAWQSFAHPPEVIFSAVRVY